MKRRNNLVTFYLISICFTFTGCATVNKNHTQAMNEAIIQLNNEDYKGATETINTIGDKKWSYDIDKSMRHVDLPKDIILQTIAAQEEIIKSVRKDCSQFKESISHEEHGQNEINKKIECLERYVGPSVHWDYILKDSMPSLLVDAYWSHELFKQSPSKKTATPIDEIIKGIIKKDIEKLKSTRNELENQLLSDRQKEYDEIERKQETKECKIIQNAFGICRARSQISMLEETIAYQKKVGSVSGVVNKQELYQAGSNLIVSRQVLAELMLQYKKLSGKSFSISDCDKYLEADQDENTELAQKKIKSCGKLR